MDVRFEVRKIPLFQLLFVQTGGSGGQAEHFQDGAALHARILNRALSKDVFTRRTPLLVGRPCQCKKRVFAGNGAAHLNGVAHSVNIRVAGAVSGIHFDAAADAQLQPSILRQGTVRGNARAEDSKACVQRLPVGQRNAQAVRPALLKTFDTGIQQQVYAVFTDMGMQNSRHFRVKRCHGLAGKLHNRNIQPAPFQVLGHLDADKACTDHNGAFHLFFTDIPVDHGGIRDIAHRKDAPAVCTGKIRTLRHTARREDQLVIAFFVLFSIRLPDRHRLFLTVDSDSFAADTHVNAEPAAQHFGLCDQKPLPVPDNSADKIRKAAVRVGNVRPLFQKNNLRFFTQAAQPAGGGSTACNTADNHNFHLSFSFQCSLIYFTACFRES